MSETFNIEMTTGPANSDGMVRVDCVRGVEAGQLAEYAELAHARRYGSDYYQATGEFVISVAILARANRSVSDDECIAIGQMNAGHVAFGHDMRHV